MRCDAIWSRAGRGCVGYGKQNSCNRVASLDPTLRPSAFLLHPRLALIFSRRPSRHVYQEPYSRQEAREQEARALAPAFPGDDCGFVEHRVDRCLSTTDCVSRLPLSALYTPLGLCCVIRRVVQKQSSPPRTAPGSAARESRSERLGSLCVPHLVAHSTRQKPLCLLPLSTTSPDPLWPGHVASGHGSRAGA
jgi:hypothetical protein